jgi:hypothetical protein
MSNQPVNASSLATCSRLITAAGDRAHRRFLEFFAANIRNLHTRRAYARAVMEFLDWCELTAGVVSIIDVPPLHVATWVEDKTRQLSAPTVKQQLVAVRHCFDWLVTGQVVSLNPAASGKSRQDAGAGWRGRPPPVGQHRYRHTGRSARSSPDGVDDLFLRPYRRSFGHEGRGRLHAKLPPVGAVAGERRQTP